MAATIKDVAKLAGVSTATVSYVINATRDVPAGTRDKVRRAMRALQYVPSAVARCLRARRSRSVGLIVPRIDNQYFINIAHGIETVLQRNGYSLVISESRDQLPTEKKLVRTFNSMQIDGLIVVACGARQDGLKKVIQGDYPVVFADRRPTGAAGDVVALDNFASTRDAVAMLLERGRRRIGMLLGPKCYSTTKDRMNGYRRAHADAGVAADEALFRHGDYSVEAGLDMSADLLRNHGVTAIFSAGSPMTLGAFIKAKELGLAIPDRLAIVGCEDAAWAAATEPPLTMIFQPSIEMGRKSAELLLKRIAKPSEAYETVFLPTHMNVRGSV